MRWNLRWDRPDPHPALTTQPLSVPTTRAELGQILAYKPENWPYLLFCGELRLGIAENRPETATVGEGAAKRNLPPSVADGVGALLTCMTTFAESASKIGEAMSAPSLAAAFSPPTAENIGAVAGAISDVYGSLWANGNTVRDLALDEDLEGLRLLALKLNTIGLDAITAFVDEFHEALSALHRIRASRTELDPPPKFNVVLTFPEDRVNELMAEIRTTVDQVMAERASEPVWADLTHPVLDVDVIATLGTVIDDAHPSSFEWGPICDPTGKQTVRQFLSRLPRAYVQMSESPLSDVEEAYKAGDRARELLSAVVKTGERCREIAASPVATDADFDSALAEKMRFDDERRAFTLASLRLVTATLVEPPDRTSGMSKLRLDGFAGFCWALYTNDLHLGAKAWLVVQPWTLPSTDKIILNVIYSEPHLGRELTLPSYGNSTAQDFIRSRMAALLARTIFDGSETGPLRDALRRGLSAAHAPTSPEVAAFALENRSSLRDLLFAAGATGSDRPSVARDAPAPEPQPYGVSPAGAEALVAQWMRHLGVADAEITRLTGDGGIDVDSARFVAQVKNYAGSVSVTEARELFGVAVSMNKQGLMFTSGTLTAEAAAFIERVGIPAFRYHAVDGTIEGLNERGVQAVARSIPAVFEQ